MRQQESIAVPSAQPISVGFFGKLTEYADNMTTSIMEIFKWHAAVIMVLIVFEVVMRYFFNAPTLWGMDVQTYLSAGGRVIGFGYASMVHSHVTMDIFTHNLSFKASKALELFNYILFHIPLIAAIAWVTLQRGLTALLRNERYYSPWKPPVAPLVLFIVSAYVLLIIQVIAEIIKDIISLRKGSDAWLKQR